jgi:hypothetical protein
MEYFRTLAVLGLLSAIACSGKAPATAARAETSNKEAGGAASQPPPIHYDQISVLTGDGQPAEQQSYGVLLENCRKSGFPTRALTSDEEAKVGRIHVEAWIAPDMQSRHEESWSMANLRPCEFSLIHEDHTEIVDANGRSTTIDGITHEVTVQELGKQGPVTAMLPGDGELSEGARRAGWSKQGMANANGAQCAIWQDSTGFQLCVWTGGRQWGYSADGSTALKDGMSRGDGIVLWAHPGRGASWKLETREFSVGKALDRHAFAIPENATHGTSP